MKDDTRKGYSQLTNNPFAPSWADQKLQLELVIKSMRAFHLCARSLVQLLTLCGGCFAFRFPPIQTRLAFSKRQVCNYQSATNALNKIRGSLRCVFALQEDGLSEDLRSSMTSVPSLLGAISIPVATSTSGTALTSCAKEDLDDDFAAAAAGADRMLARAEGGDNLAKAYITNLYWDKCEAYADQVLPWLTR